MSNDRYQQIYDILNAHYGDQNWWPAESPFEVMVGAVLVQNTAWENASSAVSALKQAGLMSAEAIAGTAPDTLAACIVSSGYFNIKARRLIALCKWLVQQGGIQSLQQQTLCSLRKELLSVHGIGPETADDILLYALHKPVFVIDAYTRRLFSRLGLVHGDLGYEDIRQCFETALEKDVAMFNQYHALIVIHAKTVCMKRPDCEACCLTGICTNVKA